MASAEAGVYHFLLVEDDADAVRLFRHAFSRTRLPAELHVVSNGEEAMHYLGGKGRYGDRKRHPLPCLILLDNRLPRKSGFEVLEWLRAQARLRNIPVIMMSTSNAPSEQRKAKELGARAFWHKPLEFQKLQALARRVATFLKLFCRRVNRMVEQDWKSLSG